MISVMIANNETGVIQPIDKIGKYVNKRYYFSYRWAQAVGKIKINVKKMNIDLMSISSHKFYGPKGRSNIYKKKTKDTFKFID